LPSSLRGQGGGEVKRVGAMNEKEKSKLGNNILTTASMLREGFFPNEEREGESDEPGRQKDGASKSASLTRRKNTPNRP